MKMDPSPGVPATQVAAFRLHAFPLINDARAD